MTYPRHPTLRSTPTHNDRLDGVRGLWPHYPIERIAYTLVLTVPEVQAEIDRIIHYARGPRRLS